MANSVNLIERDDPERMTKMPADDNDDQSTSREASRDYLYIVEKFEGGISAGDLAWEG